MKKITAWADVKFHSQMPFTNVDVCFRTREELAQFIAALQELLEASDLQTSLYLKDSVVSPDGSAGVVDALATDLCFHPPGFVRDELDLRCLAAARSRLESLNE